MADEASTGHRAAPAPEVILGKDRQDLLPARAPDYWRGDRNDLEADVDHEFTTVRRGFFENISHWPVRWEVGLPSATNWHDEAQRSWISSTLPLPANGGEGQSRPR